MRTPIAINKPLIDMTTCQSSLYEHVITSDTWWTFPVQGG